MIDTARLPNQTVIALESKVGTSEPDVHLRFTVIALLNCGREALGIGSMRNVRLDEAWCDLRQNPVTVHVAVTSSEDDATMWRGLATTSTRMELAASDVIPEKHAYRWDQDHLKKLHAEMISGAASSHSWNSRPSDGIQRACFLTTLYALTVLFIGAWELVPAAALSALVFGLLNRTKPDRGRKATLRGTIHRRRDRIGKLTTIATFAGQITGMIATAPAIVETALATAPFLIVLAVVLKVHMDDVRERRASLRTIRTAGEDVPAYAPSNRHVIAELIRICSILSEEERLEAVAAGERCRRIEDYAQDQTVDGRRLVSDILEQVSAAHGRALKYATPEEAEPLARRVLDALRAAGDEAETMRLGLLAAETDSLAMLGRYLDGRREAGGLTPVS